MMFNNIYNLFSGILGVILSVYFLKKLIQMPTGEGRQLEISNIIKNASFVYLKKQYMIIWGVSAIISLLLLKLFGLIAFAFFFVGVIASSLSGFHAMFCTVSGNVRTVEGAKQKGLEGAFKSVMYSGLSGSVFLNSLGILCVLPALYIGNITFNLTCLMVGVSLVSIFARLGGGIFTKGADVGADMVGKNQMGFDEDDARNPATIADNVGDNVGDTAGMGADLFETYVVSISSCIIIGIKKGILDGHVLPLLLCSAGLIASIIPIVFMKFKNIWQEIGGYFNTAVCLFITSSFFLFKNSTKEFVCVLIGSICVVGILKITEYYTSSDFEPVKQTAEASKSGDGANVILGLSYGFESVLIPLILILVSIMLCFHLLGVWGIALGVMGITALSPAILILDLTGPVSDNAGGIAEMSHADKSIRKITDELDAVGNTTKAITKGYSIGSAIFASLIMFYFFQYDLEFLHKIVLHINIFDSFVIVGLFFGSVLPFVFAGLTLKSVSKAAKAVVEEVRMQIENNPNIINGKEEPDYNKTVEFLTIFSIKEMILPGLLPIFGSLFMFLIGSLYGKFTTFLLLGSFLIGVTLSGSLLSIFMTISGGLWDNAKKYIEQNGEKGSDQHKAAVTGDTVGDPFKDTVGPSLNSFIKFTNIVAVLFIHLSK